MRLVALLRDENLGVTYWALCALKSISISLEGAQAAIATNVLLVSLLHNASPDVTRRALRALARLTISLEGAQAAISANVLDAIPDLLRSPNTGVREWACEMLAALACHDFIRHTMAGINPCLQLVSLLHDKHLGVTESAAKALAWLAKSLEGAQAAIDANVLDYVPDLLRCSNTGVREWTCAVLAELAGHDSVRGAMASVMPCPQLVSLLNTDPSIRRNAARALAQICKSSNGAAHILSTDFLAHVPYLMESTVQVQMCIILCNLTRYKPGGYRIISEAS
ncbi:armadillo-type protein [Mycena latifolia]|nr:armadillo-type protein [Mycena latifolia]